ncbi:hypothetical protein GCM10022221_57710 [Actinocorallia aurea]
MRAVRAALAGAGGPVVLVFDDLQWLDSPSLQVLAALAESVADLPCCVLATVRDTAPDADGPFAAVLAALTRAGAVRVGLGRFTLAETRRYVRAVGGGAVPEDQVAALHERTGGNPLFLREMTRLLAETPGGARAGLPGDVRALLAQVPDGIRDVVRVRVAALPEDVRAMLAAAAVLGRRVDVELLGRVCGLDPDEALDLVDLAVIHRVLEEDPEGIGQVRFGHALVRDAILAEMRPGRRAALHLKAADALAEDGGPVAALAAHLDAAAARMPRLAGRAVEAAEAAAEEATRRNAPYEAARWRERALRLAETDRDLPDARRHGLLVALAAARRDASDVAGAREAMLAAVALAEELRDEKGVAEALVAYGAATAPVWPGPFPDPVVLHRLEASVRGRDALDDGLGGLLLACLAAETAKTGDVAATRAVSGQAVARARAAGDVALLARILGAHLVTTWAADTVEQRIEWSRELAALPAGPAAEALGRWFAGVSLLEAGRRGESRVEVERSGRLAERLGLPALLAQQGWFAAMERFAEGDLAAAEAATDAAAALHRSTGMWGAEESVASQLFALRDEQDRLPELVPALTAVADAGMPGMIEGAALGLLRAGDETAARAALDRAFADPPLPAWGLVHSWAVRAEVCAAVGSPAQVAEAERVLAPHAGRVALAGTGVLCRGAVARLLGLLAERRGDLAEAEAHLRSALALEDVTGLTVWAAHSRVALARVLRAAGGDPGTLLDEAAATASRGLLRLARAVETARGPDPARWW